MPAAAPPDSDFRGLVWGLRRWQFVLALGMGLLALAWAANWLPQAYVHWLVKDTVGDLAEAARASDLTYEQAKTEATAIFKPVRWRLTHPAAGQWYYEGDPARPVSWDLGSEPSLPFTGVPGGPDDLAVLAVIQGSNARDGVSLTFVGRD